MKIDIELVVETFRNSFDNCRKKVGKENIIGYSVCSDDTAINVCPRVATQKGIINFPLESKNDFKFNPDEWDLDADYDLTNELSNSIYDLYEKSEDYEGNPDWHNEHRSYIYNLFFEALLRLDKENYFGSEDEKKSILIIPWVNDSLEPKKKGIKWSELLNNPEIHLEFKNWMEEKKY